MCAVSNRFWGIWGKYVESDCQLSPEQLKRLGQHKYSAVDTSWLDELCMKRFWDKVVLLYPLWLAPNLITLTGFLINLITVLILSQFCYSATEEAPAWAYFQAGLGLFLYQTLDATDGKQARRTGSSSPLGELFDHGCDSVSQVFVTLNICYALQLGDSRYAVLTITALSNAVFYCAHWSTYCTGKLRFARFDVTEAQMVVIFVMLITTLFGPSIWAIEILGLQLKYIVVLASILIWLWQIDRYATVILTEGAGKNGSTVAGTSILSPLIPIIAVILPFCMIYSKSTLYDENITLFCLCFGAVAAKASNRIIIAHMSRSELVLWDWIYLGPLVMVFNYYYDVLFDEYIVLVLATVYACISLIVFCTKITHQFCADLKIYCFTLKKPEQ
ncbi:hypothetical protein QR680_018795 [Steinernema hermaphroditum]|uniref:diacylglycerol cholinephosphotransferase n=1 Tax=Steinernema hermaphroditum TaxID=289476 RepID=A0AA39LRA3_9BILA|nr:hypothetical protein QR680_018795 [Steinernema hermaphroditum]